MRGKNQDQPLVERVVQVGGGRTARIEEQPNLLAVRYRAEALDRVRDRLKTLGTVRALPAYQLLVLDLRTGVARELALTRLGRLEAEDLIEFFTPVLRDSESGLQMILTDEITVRFKELPPEHLERDYGVTVARRNEFVPNQLIVKVDQPDGLKTLDVANQIASAADVVFAVPNFISEHTR